MEALALVAHPDDETIWMGGTILQNKNWNWTIVSLCRKADPDRQPKFVKVCKHYNATPIISDLDDEKLHDLSTEEVVKKIQEVLPKKNFDVIYTHGKNGEYGHKRHKEVHRAVKKMLSEKQLKCDKVFYFAYENSKQTFPGMLSLHIALPRADAKTRTTLTKDNFKKKRMLIISEYGFRGDSFEALCCNQIETFDKK